jgi:hypothetical protein
MSRQITIPAKTAQEEIACLEEFPNKVVRVRVRVVDSDGNEVPTAGQQIFTIEGDNLTELLSPNPAWSPNKPGGTYANDDLWHFIDLIRSGT